MDRTADGRLLVVTDANILVNFLKVGRFDLLSHLRAYAFRIPEEVYREIAYPDQRTRLDEALDEGWIEKVRITAPDEISIFHAYRERMDDGEAACLAVAVLRRWIIACDEGRRKPVYREVQKRIGTGHFLNTPGILVRAIREELLTFEEADRIRDDLEYRHRFKMAFRSFRELLDR